MKLSISKKIISTVVVTVLIVSTVFSFTAFYYLSKNFNEKAEQEITQSVDFIQSQLDKLEEKVKGQAIISSMRPDVAAAVSSGNTKYLQDMGREIMKYTGLDIITISDKNGMVLARAHSEKIGDNVANQTNIK